MSNIRKNLMAGEVVLFHTRKHLILFFWPAVLAAVGLFVWQYLNTVPLMMRVSWVPPLVVALVWMKFLVEYYCSEFVVTNQRVWMREGFLVRKTHETRLQAIAKINVDQSLIAQMFGYGTISLHSFSADYDVFDLIANPIQFQYQVNRAMQGVHASASTPTI